MINWQHSPQRQKALQKINAMTPYNKSLARLLINELQGRYAGEEMRKELDAMQLAATEKERQRNLATNERRLALREKGLDLDKSSGKTAETLGYLNIGSRGLFGLADLKRKRNYATQLRNLAQRY